MSKITPLSVTDIDSLTNLIESWSHEVDPYLSAPAYYLLTLRKGMWLYEHKAGNMIFGWHPNVTDQLLAFPPFGSEPQAVLHSFLQKLDMPPQGLCIGRLQDTSTVTELCDTFDETLDIQTGETVLDWHYPCHVLDTRSMSELPGRAYGNVRNHVYRMQRPDVRVESLDIPRQQ